MRDYNNEFTNVIQSSTKESRWVVEIALDDAATDLVYFTSHSDVPVPNGSVVVHEVLQGVSSLSQKLDQFKFNSTIGNLSFSLVNLRGQVESLFRGKRIAGEHLYGKRVRLIRGAKGIAWPNYIIELTQWISKRFDYRKSKYLVKCEDSQIFLNRTICRGKETRLAAAIDENTTTVPVYRTDEFSLVQHGAEFSEAPNQLCTFIEISDNKKKEFCKVTVINQADFTVTRGAFGSDPQDWSVPQGANEDKGPKVKELIAIDMNMVEFAWSILTGEDLDNPGTPLFPEHWHSHVPPDQLVRSEFLALRTINSTRAQHMALKKANAKQFFEEQVCLPLGHYLRVNGLGSMNLKALHGIHTDSNVVGTITADQVSNFGSLTHDSSEIVNLLNVFWSWDERPSKPQYRRLTPFVIENSKAEFGEKEKTVYLQMINGNSSTSSTLIAIANRYMDRYAGDSAYFSIDVLHKLSAYEIGDVVQVEHHAVADFTGEGSFGRPMQIIEKRISQSRGITFKLFGSTFVADPITDGDVRVMNDSFYPSEGQLIPNVALGVLTADTILVGTIDMNAAASVYFVDDDFTLPIGKTLTIVGNVQIRVRGFFDRHGEIVCTGGGDVSVVKGWVGDSRGGDGYNEVNYVNPPSTSVSVTKGSTFEGINDAFPALDLVNNAGDSIAGIPTELRGCSGANGAKSSVTNRANSPEPDFAELDGALPVKGGAGLTIICRGMGGNGQIDLSGERNNPAPTKFFAAVQKVIVAGESGDGAPGSLLILIDGGGTSAIPQLAGRITALGDKDINLGMAPLRVQVIPQAREVSEDDPIDEGEPGVAKFRQTIAPTDALCRKIYGRNLKVGDEWIVTSNLDIFIEKFWDGNAWVDDPIQSIWSLVTGAGKPADDATRNTGALADRNNVDWSMDVVSRPPNLTALSGTENIQNAQISINPDGSLSGAGFGQVTIGGLGYLGDLNATRNIGALADRNDVNWSQHIISRPLELIDGRLAAGLNSTGEILRDVPAGLRLGGGYKAEDLASIGTMGTHGGSLVQNSDMTVVGADGRPAGVKAVYSGSDPTVISYQDASKTILKLWSSTDSALGVGWPAFRLSLGVSYRIVIRVKSNLVSSTGFYFRMQEFDAELPGGITHISTGGSESGVVQATRQVTSFRENKSIGTAWEEYEWTYKPTATAKWTSPIMLDWTGMGFSELHVDRLAIYPFTESILDLDYVGALNADATNYSDTRVANNQISINASGILSGAGGGQVTINGLGFSGDLNATRGAPSGTLINGTPVETIHGYANRANLGLDVFGDVVRPLKNNVVTQSNITQHQSAIDGHTIANGTAMDVGDSTSPLIIAFPGGGTFHKNLSNQTGAFKIALPVLWTSTMLKFRVSVYNYATNKSFTVDVGGYNYAGSSQWYNTTAVISGNSNTNHTVRFGHDGAKSCVWIGETNSVWQYPQVKVTNFEGGFRSAALASWASGWNISLVTAFNTIQITHADASIGSWNNAVNRPINLAALNGSEAINNTQISLNSDGSLMGGGGGQVNLLGLGFTGDMNADATNYNDSRVANSRISINPNGTLSGAGFGQVTITGLGYSGALNATYGAPAGTLVSGTLAQDVSSRVSRVNNSGRPKDQRFYRANIMAFNNTAKTGGTISSSDAGSTATISIAAWSIVTDHGTINYNSGTLTGRSFSTTYYIYCVDPNQLGGAVSYFSTTSYSTVASNADRVYVGKVTTVNNGGSGGSGGGGGDDWCVAISEYLPGFGLAGEVYNGAPLIVLKDDLSGVEPYQVKSFELAKADCVRLTTESGIQLMVSESTPLTLVNGRVVNVLKGLNEVVPTIDNGKFKWKKLIKIESVGNRTVNRIHCDGKTYAAGSVSGRYILTHNPVKP